jgi:hypothetical protein
MEKCAIMKAEWTELRFWCMPYYRTMACSKQLKNMLEAAQPPAPIVNEFMTFVHKVAAGGQKAAQPENAIFDNILGEAAAAKAAGSARNEVNGAKLAIEYNAMLQRQEAVAALDLDSWFCGLVQFVINVELVSDDKETQQALLQKRKALCGDHSTPRSLSCESLRTYMNATTRAVKEACGPVVVIPSMR